MSKEKRTQILAELASSIRLTGQMFFKCIKGALHNNPVYNQASLPILKVLAEKGPVHQHAIAKELSHTDASVSRQIKLLTQKGQISTHADPDNRRLTIVTLTPKGQQALKEIEKVILGYLSQLLAPLPDDKLKLIIKANTEIQSVITNQSRKEPHE